MPRQRLVRMLLDGLRRKLTLLCAPAGSGKTTALIQFAARADIPTIWHRLDRSDRDPTVFANRLLRGVAPYIDRSTSTQILVLEAWNTRAVLSRLVNALSRAAEAADGQLAILLDDYHKVGSSEPVNELVAGVIDLTPPGVHFLMSSRSVPTLPLAKLRLDGDLLEITQHELALDPSEVSALLSDWRGLHLSEEEVGLVLDKTGGWVAGVSMLAESLKSRDKDEMIAFLRGFSGNTAVVYDYFAEEVLRQQPPAIQQFLISTSLLSELHRDLVNPMLGIKTGQSILESLAADNLFVASLDEDRDWYSYHPLFREFLRGRAEKTLGQPAMRRLHKKAATAYAAQQNWGRAIDHLRTAECFEEAAATVERVGERFVGRGNLETVKGWLSSLPDPIKRNRPWLMLIEGQIACSQGSYSRAALTLARAQTLFAESSHRVGLARVAVERALISFRTGNHREAIDLLECALGAAPDDQTRADMLGTLCINYREIGELEQSSRFGEAALKVVAGPGPPSRRALESRTLRTLAQTSMIQGDHDLALSLLFRAGELCRREMVGGLEPSWVVMATGIVRTVRGEAELALDAFRAAEELGACYVESKRHRLYTWRGNALTDLGHFAQAEQCYQLVGLPTPERGWLLLRRREVAHATSVVGQTLAKWNSSEPLPRASLTCVLGIATEMGGHLARGASLLQKAADTFATHGYAHHLVSLQLHLARMLVNTGQAVSGIQLLRRALLAAEGRGYYHFYWWDPELLAPVLRLALDDDRFRAYVERIVDRHPSEGDRQTLGSLLHRHPASNGGYPDGALGSIHKAPDYRVALDLASCADTRTRERIERELACSPLASNCVARLRDRFGLTWREVEVFLAYYLDRRFYEGGGGGPMRSQLADDLCMTENTLKSHIKSIRRKLHLSAGADSLQVYRTVVGPAAGSEQP